MGGVSLVKALIVCGESKDTLDNSPTAVVVDLLREPLGPASRCRLSSIPTYCNPFCRNEIKAPGGIDLSAFLMLDLPSMLSYTKVNEL